MTLSVDTANTPATAVNTTNTTVTTTASFTPQANTLLVVEWSSNTGTGDSPGAPSISGGGLTWTLQQWRAIPNSPSASGQVAIWTAPMVSSAALTVAVTTGEAASGFKNAAIRVIPVIDDSGGLPTVGASAKGASLGTTTAFSFSFTASATGSLGFGVTCDWDVKGVESAGSGTTLLASANIASDITYGFFRRTTADGVAASATTLNITLPVSSTNFSWAAVEVVPPVGGVTVTAIGVARHTRWPGRGPKGTRRRVATKLGSDVPATVSNTLTSNLDLIATDGTAPTTGNSNISATANNTLPTIFASTDIKPPHAGTTVTKYSMATSIAAVVAWDLAKWTPGSPAAGLTLYNDFYYYLAVLPGATVGLTVSTNPATVASSSLRIQSNGRMQAFATTSTSLGLMSTPVPLGSWVRVATKTFMDATNGFMVVRLFTNPESTVPTEEFTSSLGNTLNAQTGISRVGIGSLGGGTTALHYFADVRWSDTDWLLPIGSISKFIGWGMGVNN